MGLQLQKNTWRKVDEHKYNNSHITQMQNNGPEDSIRILVICTIFQLAANEIYFVDH